MPRPVVVELRRKKLRRLFYFLLHKQAVIRPSRDVPEDSVPDPGIVLILSHRDDYFPANSPVLDRTTTN